MTKEFVPYELALRMKQFGFNEPCFGEWQNLKTGKNIVIDEEDRIYDVPVLGADIKAPTYSQAFRWFREKHGLCIVIKPIDDKNLELGYNLLKNGLMMGSYLTYEEAESACLIKLTELAEARI